MQPYRVYSTAPTRVALRRVPSNSRNMAYCTPFGFRVARRSVPAPFFPSVQADFSPFLRMFNELDQISSSLAGSHLQQQQRQVRSFQPRFDVREENDAYHLQGELPGVNQDNLNIEFTDSNTLLIRGQTVRERQSGTPPQAVQAAGEPKAIEQDNASTDNTDADIAPTEPERSVSPVSEAGSNYKRPSVEEERDEDWVEAVPTPVTPATEVAKPAEEQVAKSTPAPQDAEPQQEQQEQQQSRYWVSERSVGTFQRSFKFPGQIDQDSVTASLKDGVLNVVVPKQQPKQPRKIAIL